MFSLFSSTPLVSSFFPHYPGNFFSCFILFSLILDDFKPPSTTKIFGTVRFAFGRFPKQLIRRIVDMSFSVWIVFVSILYHFHRVFHVVVSGVSEMFSSLEVVTMIQPNSAFWLITPPFFSNNQFSFVKLVTWCYWYWCFNIGIFIS